VSCSLHDVITLEARGTPAVAIGTEPFVAEAEEQARVLAMPGQRLLTVPHPIQPTPVPQVQGYADDVVTEAVRRLTTPPPTDADADADPGRPGST
jgi:hypothetical protein